MADNTIWRVKIAAVTWNTDAAAASEVARGHGDRWRLRLQKQGGIPQGELLACRAEDDRGVDLTGCVKTRIPDPSSPDLAASPWGAVLRLARDQQGLHLVLVAFGLRHPEAVGSTQPSVYERAHRRLNPR